MCTIDDDDEDDDDDDDADDDDDDDHDEGDQDDYDYDNHDNQKCPLSLASKFHHKLPTFPRKKNIGNSSASPWVACMMSPRSGGIAGAAVCCTTRGIGRGDETILDLKKMFPKKDSFEM